jgi:hypothetical protein
MNSKTKNDIAMFLLGASNIPPQVPSHTKDAAFATRHLKLALDTAQSYSDVADKVRDRHIAAEVYSTKTKLKWPF